MDVLLDIVDMMSQIKCCKVIKSVYDVICIAYGVINIDAVMTYLHFFS